MLTKGLEGQITISSNASRSMRGLNLALSRPLKTKSVTEGSH